MVQVRGDISMVQVKRLGHATFKTPDLERIVDYWTRIIGLTLVDKDKNHAFLATKYGEEAVAVETGDGANLVKAAFQVAPGTELADVQKALAKEGVKSELQSDISPGGSGKSALSTAVKASMACVSASMPLSAVT